MLAGILDLFLTKLIKNINFSGCITSAESILIESQGVEEFLKQLSNTNQFVVVTLSQQTQASIGNNN